MIQEYLGIVKLIETKRIYVMSESDYIILNQQNIESQWDIVWMCFAYLLFEAAIVEYLVVHNHKTANKDISFERSNTFHGMGLCEYNSLKVGINRRNFR